MPFGSKLDENGNRVSTTPLFNELQARVSEWEKTNNQRCVFVYMSPESACAYEKEAAEAIREMNLEELMQYMANPPEAPHSVCIIFDYTLPNFVYRFAGILE